MDGGIAGAIAEWVALVLAQGAPRQPSHPALASNGGSSSRLPLQLFTFAAFLGLLPTTSFSKARKWISKGHARTLPSTLHGRAVGRTKGCLPKRRQEVVVATSVSCLPMVSLHSRTCSHGEETIAEYLFCGLLLNAGTVCFAAVKSVFDTVAAPALDLAMLLLRGSCALYRTVLQLLVRLLSCHALLWSLCALNRAVVCWFCFIQRLLLMCFQWFGAVFEAQRGSAPA
ncbi:hypothetical protein L7F22_023604 [Adiantum nelumboides]|nr:hypothetical protein [Adiantum nelumboides]